MMLTSYGDDLRLPSAAHGERLCDFLPVLRMTALGLTQKRAEADDILWDAILEWLVAQCCGRGGQPVLAHLVSLMRTARDAGTRVGERAARDGVPWAEDWALRATAGAIFHLPPEERAAIILLTLLRVRPERAAELAECTPETIAARDIKARARLAAQDVPDFGATYAGCRPALSA